MVHRWNNTGEKPKYFEKNMSCCHIFTINHTRTGLELNPGLRGKFQTADLPLVLKRVRLKPFSVDSCKQNSFKTDISKMNVPVTYWISHRIKPTL